ncbi:MAG: Fe-S cluster assembly ATPase SufC [Candidatus Micrarchaeia archaeon]
MKLNIENLKAYVGDKEILKGINLTINDGEIHVIMGPNGSGKTTLAKAIMGHPLIKISGKIFINDRIINNLSADERAKLGLFLLFQNPPELEGVKFISFLRSAKESLENRTIDIKNFMSEIKGYASKLKMDNEIIGRQLNYGFSGGEKKKAEILQMSILKPKLAILDEPDSGLDVDSIKLVMNNIKELIEKSHIPVLIITHYNRIFNYIKPQYVHVMIDGKIVVNGGPELIDIIENRGYDYFSKKL